MGDSPGGASPVAAIGHSFARGCTKMAGFCSCCKGRGTYRCAAEANALATGASWLGVSWLLRRYGRKLNKEVGRGTLGIAGE